jgi:hypothetical protein
MNRDEILRLAREAGLKLFNEGWTSSDNGDAVTEESLERFAALVAAHEREECAKVCEELELKNAAGQYGTYVAGWSDGTDDCAAAIRSRT